MSMNFELDQVKTFHEKMDISHQRCFPSGLDDPDLRAYVEGLVQTLKQASAQLEQCVDEPTGIALRLHLSLEELAEWGTALLTGNRLLGLDALADRLYVLFGDAVMFKLPLGSAFHEVHRSNMTKVKQDDDPARARLREKGALYQPPELSRVLKLFDAGSIKW